MNFYVHCILARDMAGDDFYSVTNFHPDNLVWSSKVVGSRLKVRVKIEYLSKRRNKHTCDRVKSSEYSNGTKSKINNFFQSIY